MVTVNIQHCLKGVLFICLLLGCLSCQEKKDENRVNLLKAWMNKEIQIPQMSFYSENTAIDTVDICGRYSILSYVDSIGCLSCRFNIEKWKELQDEMNKYNIPVYIYIHSRDIAQIERLLRRHKTNLNICFDKKDSLNQLNHFPTDMAFQTFLLDKDNKVVAIGNPVHNPKVKELYLKIIQGKESTESEKPLTTEIEIKEQTISLGRFDWKEEKQAVFKIKNIGGCPLVINDVATSCGCTSVDYPKEPVRPGDSISLQVNYKADHPEHFDKTITVYCNANPSLVRLKITGDAE